MTPAKTPESSNDPRRRNREKITRLDQILKALSHPVRRHILLTLKFRGERVSSGDIASRYACTWPTVARHLGVLKKARLVAVQRSGRNLIYELNKDVMKEVLEDWLSYFD
jgi:DNA-binding transcriptional ArsR family regulator